MVMLIGIVMVVLVWVITRRTLQPIAMLTNTVSAIAAGDLNRTVEVKAQDEIGTLAHTFNVMTGQLRNLIGNLEQRVADRTHDLELAAEVGRTVTEKVKQQSEMLAEAAEMIRARFALYYTQVYLFEPAEERLVLHAGTGEAGKELLRRGHSLVVNSGSLNGRAVLEQRAQIVPDTTQNPTFLPNPLLPDTRSEMCVPLIVDEKVVGVLDMQSEQAGALSESNLPAFAALAGQLAVAIRNATLFTEVQQARTEMEAQIGHSTEEAWADFLNAIQEGHRMGFTFENNQVAPLNTDKLSATSHTDRFDMPIMVTAAKVGRIQLPANLKPNELELVKSISEQLAQHVENLRLLAQAERFQKEAEQAVRRLMHEGWENFLSASQSKLGYVYDLNQVQPLTENRHDDADQAFKQPLIVREETIGELKLDLPDSSEEAVEIVSAVAQQLSGHLETLRLSEINERNAQREQTLRQITSALRSSTNPATIMRTAAREVGIVLGRRTVVQVVPPEQVSQAESIPGSQDKADSPADQS
jgi:GAF domain-containing protein